MTVKLLNQTNYANIYGLIDKDEKIIGTLEEVLAGRNVGAYYGSWSKYTKSQIKKMFKEIQKEEK